MEQKELKNGTIVREAMAKINLALDVTGKRENGYHEVKMIMQTVHLFDTLTFTKTTTPKIVLHTNNPEIPIDKRNLIYKAAQLLIDNYQIKEGVSITLEKRIPVAAGMAGGSTDAAATLLGMNELFELKLSIETLKELGVKLGADVPYCVQGGTALSEGIGEILTALPKVPDCFLLIAKPDINVSTKMVYENLHLEGLKKHPDVDGMVEAISHSDLQGIADRMENVLESVTEKKYPVIAKIKEAMLKEGAINSLMSGSGPTVFGLYKTKEQAQKAYETMKSLNLVKQLFVTTFYQG